MRGPVAKLLALAAVCAAALAFAAPALAAPAISGIFPLGSEIETNNKITEGPDGNVWFTLAGKKVGRITPQGAIKEFELKGIEGAIGIATGPEGRLWIVGTGKAASFLPTNPEGSEEDFASALINANANIVLGPEKMFWVASNESVAKFSPADFNGSIAPVAVEGELSPRDIDVAGSLIAIADVAEPVLGKGGRIVTFTTAGKQHDVAIPGASQGVAGGPGGLIGFTAPGASPEQSGLIPSGGTASSFELTGDPFGITFGQDQAFWIAQFGPPGGLTRVATNGTHTSIGGLPTMTARQITPGPGHTLWVTMVENATLKSPPSIARVTGVEPPPTPAPGPIPVAPVPPVVKPALPTTKLGSKPKKVVKITGSTAQVKFGFSSTTAGARFECALGHRVKPKGKKARFVGQSFKSCGSPKKYTLGPGRYRFQVRAVAGGVRDSSPAAFGFKVVRTGR
jgi:streptogramin lyase